MKYVTILISLVFLFGFLAMSQETSTEGTTPGIAVKGVPERTITSPNASVPNKISYQGILTSSGGAPVADGAYDIKFELFNVASGGTGLWSETQTAVPVLNGTFSVLLGSVTPLIGIFYQPLWVEITVVSGPGIGSPIVFSPRTELASAAYALGPWYSDVNNIWVWDNKNVGINTNNPSFPLEVFPFSTATVAKFGSNDAIYLIQNNPHVGFNIYFSGGFRYGSTNHGGATIAYDQHVNNGLTFNTAPDGNANEIATLSTRMTIMEDGKVGIGTTSPDKLLTVAGTTHILDTLFVGSNPPLASIEDYQVYGGEMKINDELGNKIVYMRPNGWGTGGGIQVYRNTSDVGFEAWGDWWGQEEGYAAVYGKNRSILFEPRFAGNASVQLPDSSISAVEMLNEPGIAEQNSSGTTLLTSTTMVDVDTISITIPSAGYIIIEAKSIAFFSGVTGNNQLFAQIDETPGGSFNSPHWVRAGLVAYPSTGAYNFFPIYVTRTYYKSSAGTYSFRLEAAEDGGNASGNTCGLYQTQITAIFMPTAYGAVQTLTHGTAINDPSVEAGPPTQVEDLRELELRVVRAQAEAERAERELLEAQLKQQQPSGNDPR